MISEIIDCDNETARSLENIEKLIFGTAWNYEIIQEKIKNKKFKYWIYEVENSIKGYLGIQFLEEEIEIQLKRLPESSAAHISIKNNGAFVVVDTDDEIVQFCNQFAPEHLCLLNKEPEELMPKLKAAGGIFVGENSPEVLGDYTAGPSHSMPTSLAARHSSPVSVSDFLKITPS